MIKTRKRVRQRLQYCDDNRSIGILVWFRLVNPCIRNPIIMLRRPSTSRDISHGELFWFSLETTRAFIIKKGRKRTTRLPTQDVPPILAAPTLNCRETRSKQR